MYPSTGWEPLVSPFTGSDRISRTELMTVMIPTYRSPPYTFRVALHTTCTRQFVPCMMKPDMPRAAISRASFQSTGRFCLRICSPAFLPVRKRSTQTQDTVWLKMVARAAPPTPMSSAKMNTGSRARFSTAPIRVVIMPVFG